MAFSDNFYYPGCDRMLIGLAVHTVVGVGVADSGMMEDVTDGDFRSAAVA